MTVYLATAFADGPLLAARVAAELPDHGLALVEGGDWWAWPKLPRESDYTEKLRAQTLVIREEHAISQCGRVLVLLTDDCGMGTGGEAQYARLHGLKLYWMDCRLPTDKPKEVPPILVGFGVRVRDLAELAVNVKGERQ